MNGGCHQTTTIVFMSFSKDLKVTGGAPNIGTGADFIGSLIVIGFAGFSSLIPLTAGRVLGFEWGLGGVRGE